MHGYEIRRDQPAGVTVGKYIAQHIDAAHLRPVAGVRRAIPRKIHGVRLAITATARSERRIAVRGPGVGCQAPGTT